MKQMLEKERRERELINQQLAALEAKLVSGGGACRARSHCRF